MSGWEITPVVERDGEMEMCEPEEATFFGLYYRDVDGLARWAADFASERVARLVAEALNLLGAKGIS